MFISSIKPTIYIFLIAVLQKFPFVFGGIDRKDFNDITQDLTDREIDLALSELSLTDLNVLKQLVDAPNIDADYSEENYLASKRELPAQVKDDNLNDYEDDEQEYVDTDVDKQHLTKTDGDLAKIQISQNDLMDNDNQHTKNYRNIKPPKIVQQMKQLNYLVNLPLSKDLLDDERSKRRDEMQRNTKKQLLSLMRENVDMKQQENDEATKFQRENDLKQFVDKQFVSVVDDDEKHLQTDDVELENEQLNYEKRSQQHEKQQQQSNNDFNDNEEEYDEYKANDNVKYQQQSATNAQLKEQKRYYLKDQQRSLDDTSDSEEEADDEEEQTENDKAKLKDQKRNYQNEQQQQSSNKENQQKSQININDNAEETQENVDNDNVELQQQQYRKDINDNIDKDQEQQNLQRYYRKDQQQNINTQNLQNLQNLQNSFDGVNTNKDDDQQYLQRSFADLNNEKTATAKRLINDNQKTKTQQYLTNENSKNLQESTRNAKRYCRHDRQQTKLKPEFEQTLDDYGSRTQQENHDSSSLDADVRIQDLKAQNYRRDHRENQQSNDIKEQIEQSFKEFKSGSSEAQIDAQSSLNGGYARQQRLKDENENENENENDEQNNDNYQSKIKEDLKNTFDEFEKQTKLNRNNFENTFNNDAENVQKINIFEMHNLKTRHQNDMAPKYQQNENLPQISNTNKETEFQYQLSPTINKRQPLNPIQRLQKLEHLQQLQQQHKQLLDNYKNLYLTKKREDPKYFRLVYEPFNKNSFVEKKSSYYNEEDVPNIDRDYQLKSLYTADQLNAVQKPLMSQKYTSVFSENFQNNDDGHVETYFDDPYFLDRNEGPQHIINNYKIHDQPFTEEFIKAGNIEETKNKENNNGELDFDENRMLRKAIKRNDYEKYHVPIEENALNVQNDVDINSDYPREKRHTSKKPQPIYVDEEYLKQLEDSFPRDQEQNKYKDMNKVHIRVKRY